MLLDTEKKITVLHLMLLARDLKSEHGENPEYDRALVNLCADAAGCLQEENSDMAHLLGIRLKNELPTPTA